MIKKKLKNRKWGFFAVFLILVLSQATFVHAMTGEEDVDEKRSQFSRKLAIVGKTAKQVDYVSSWTQMGADIGSAILYIFGYDNIASRLEKLSIASKFTGGASKLVYGTTDTILTGEGRQILTVGMGIIQMGSSCLQYETFKKHQTLKLRKQELEKRLEENRLNALALAKQKTELNECLNVEDFEKHCREIEENNKLNKDEYCTVIKEQRMCDNQILGVECAEEVFQKTIADVQQGEDDIQGAFLKHVLTTLKKGGLKMASQTLKENKEDVRDFIYSVFDNIKEKFKDTILTDFVNKTLEKDVDTTRIERELFS